MQSGQTKLQICFASLSIMLRLILILYSLIGSRIEVFPSNVSHFFFQELNHIRPYNGSGFPERIVDEPFACFDLLKNYGETIIS